MARMNTDIRGREGLISTARRRVRSRVLLTAWSTAFVGAIRAIGVHGLPAQIAVHALPAFLGVAIAGAHSGQGNSVKLEVRPSHGDTIRVRLDQTVEMTGPAGADGKAVVESGTLVLLATLAVESVDQQGATIVSVTDSVRVNSPPNSASSAVLAWAAIAANRAVRFRVAPNGSAYVPSGRGRAAPSPSLAAAMPATLPSRAIAPGTTWNSVLQVPLASSVDPGGTATLVATFTFDSLSRSGELAFLSLRGRLTKTDPEGAPPTEGETRVETSGTVEGQVLLDRRRGWITDARTTFSLLSLVTSAEPGKTPVRVKTTISQWLRAM